MNERSLENLIPFDRRDPEEHMELSRKGGLRSGESRKERRQLREELTTLLSSGDLQERVCLALIDKAIAGDPRAFIALRDSLGEKLPDGLALEVTGNAQDLQGWKEAHYQEIRKLFIDELDNPEISERYGDLAGSLLTYQERMQILTENE